jgi:hypothetical protein
LEEPLLRALLESGRLTEGEALRRDLVAREAALLLDEWAKLWLKNVTS